MKQFICLLKAFLVRDFRIAASYKLQFAFHLFNGFFMIAIFYFVARMINQEAADNLTERYNTDYFSFVLIGVTATGFLQSGLASFAVNLRIAMTEGSLEMMFASPTRPIWILTLPCMWNFLFEGTRALLITIVGVFLFGAQLNFSSLPAGIAVLFLTVTTYNVFGLFSAGIIMMAKRGDPINWALGQASALVSGAYFPLDVLPDWLASVAKVLPMTYSYHGLRMTFLNGASLSAVWFDLLVLFGFTVVGGPIAIAVCNLAVSRAKVAGSLGAF